MKSGEIWCWGCMQELPSEAFNVYNYSRCKKCLREYQKEYYKNNIERIKAYKKNPRNVNRDKETIHKRTWRKRHPDRAYAQGVITQKLQTGVLKPQPCSICGVFPAEAHHPDYDKPYEIVWLCNPHHREIHNKKKLC